MITHKSLPVAAAIGLAVGMTIGCEVPELPPDQAASTPAATAPAEPAPERGTAAAATHHGEALPDTGDVAPVTEEGRAVTAKDPAKGRKSRNAGGYLGAVAGARFWAEHQMILNSIKHATQLFWGMEGRYPNSNEEFMTRIIQENQIVLPELPDDQEYFYDPERSEEGLLVRLKQSE